MATANPYASRGMVQALPLRPAVLPFARREGYPGDDAIDLSSELALTHHAANARRRAPRRCPCSRSRSQHGFAGRDRRLPSLPTSPFSWYVGARCRAFRRLLTFRRMSATGVAWAPQRQLGDRQRLARSGAGHAIGATRKVVRMRELAANVTRPRAVAGRRSRRTGATYQLDAFPYWLVHL